MNPARSHLPDPELDGRRARSARSRDAIARALHDLVRETGRPPTVEEIAERAGVSRRSVFRRFDDLDSLYAAAHIISRADLRARFPRLNLSGKPLGERIDLMARRTGRIYEYLAPVIRASRQLRGEVAFVDERIAADASELRARLEQVFADALVDDAPAERQEKLDALQLTFGWPAWDALRRERGLRVLEARQVVARLARGLLRRERV